MIAFMYIGINNTCRMSALYHAAAILVHSANVIFLRTRMNLSLLMFCII